MLEYEVALISESADVTHATVKEATITVDTSADGSAEAPNAAELLLAAIATCMTKGVRRAARLNRFEIGQVVVKIRGTRQDAPPKMDSVHYEILVETQESDRRLELLHRNVLRFGTVTNSIDDTVKLDGTLQRMPPST